ncbi:MAG: hypothetical protein ACKOYI_10490, partial [Actinomycetota bacterium]
MPTSGVDDRKIAVLRAVIEHYVSTGQPVGSSHVAAMPGITVSAATIRNDMVLVIVLIVAFILLEHALFSIGWSSHR